MDSIEIINGDLSFLCEFISEAEGFDVPTTREVFIDPPEREGSLFISELAGKREMSFKGLIKDDIQTNRRLLARVCQPGGLKTLKFELCDGVLVQIDATLKLVNAYSKTRSPYLITAKAPNPYFLSQETHTAFTPITSRKGGMAIPAPVPAPIGAGGGAPFIITNAGDIDSRPIFTIQGPGSNFLVQNLDTGESFRLVTSLTAAETAIINTITNEAIKGSQNVFGLITRDPVGQWLKLKPGQNRIVFKAISGTTAATKLTIQWQDTYSGF